MGTRRADSRLEWPQLSALERLLHVTVPQTSDLVVQTAVPQLVLRELTLGDEDAYFALVDRNREHLTQRGDYTFEGAASRDDIRAYFATPRDDNVRLGLWFEGQLIGRVDLVPINPPNWVIGYWLDSGWTGRGFMTAACRAAIEHARELGATEIYAGITNGNSSSVGVVNRLGFDHVQDVENRSRWRLALIDDPPPPVMA
jgi:RimJ/RimL family protein N-acetyltransferase